MLNKFFYWTVLNSYNIWQLKNGCNKYSNNRLIFPLLEYGFKKKQEKYGCYIDLKTKFDNIPLFPHDLYGIFISGGSSLGENCIIYHHVTIGSNTLQDSKNYGAPKIGNNVLIGAGAKLIGNITIGDNCRIGANCTVTFDMPPNAVAVAQPARMIQKDDLENTFVKKANGIEYAWVNGKWETKK
jgi:serine acetyltransferase